MLIEGLNRINAFKTSVIREWIQERLICSFFFFLGADSKLRFAIIIFPSQTLHFDWLTVTEGAREEEGEGQRGGVIIADMLPWHGACEPQTKAHQ